MTRRSFFALVAGLPLVGRLIPKEDDGWHHMTFTWTPLSEPEPFALKCRGPEAYTVHPIQWLMVEQALRSKDRLARIRLTDVDAP